MPKGDYQQFKADIEDGIVPIAHLLLEALAMAQLNGVAKGIVMFVWRRTYGWTREDREKHRADRITLAEFAQAVNSERTYVSKQLKLLIKARVLQETADPYDARYKVFGMNTDISSWDEEVINIDALYQAAQDKLYFHSSKVAQKHNRCVNEQPLCNQTTVVQMNNRCSIRQPLCDQTTQPLCDRTTFTPENPNDGAENGASKNSIKNINTIAAADPPYNPPFVGLMNDVEQKMQIRMVNPNYYVHGTDLDALKEIHASGIPPDVVLNGIDQAFERYKPRHPRDKVNSFTYCLGAIYDLWTKQTIAATSGGGKIEYRNEVGSTIGAGTRRQNSAAAFIQRQINANTPV